MLLPLLDEISCINFFLYTVIFRPAEVDTWLHALFRVFKVFIIFNRRNYNNATLCQQNGFLFHLTDNPDIANNFQSHLEVLTEKKTEILHSLFRG